MNDKVYIARPNWAILDWMIMFGAVYGAVSVLDWLGDLLPAWLQWLLLPFALAFFVGILIAAYKMTIYSQCDGDYDNA